MAAPKAPPKQPEPIQTFILSSLCQVLGQELMIPTPRISLTEDWGDVTRTQPADKRQTQSGLRLDGFRVLRGDDGRGSAGALRAYALQSEGVLSGGFKNMRLPSGSVQIAAMRATLVPTMFNFTLMFSTFDSDLLLDFMSRWIFAEAKDRLSYSLRYLDNQFPITVKPSADLSVPSKTSRGEDAQPLRYEGSIEVLGYTALYDKRDTREVPLVLDTKVTIERT